MNKAILLKLHKQGWPTWIVYNGHIREANICDDVKNCEDRQIDLFIAESASSHVRAYWDAIKEYLYERR